MKLTKFGILVNKTTSLFTSIRDSKISRGCLKILENLEGREGKFWGPILENPEGRGGHMANPFRGGGGGMEIFWNHTFACVFQEEIEFLFWTVWSCKKQFFSVQYVRSSTVNYFIQFCSIVCVVICRRQVVLSLASFGTHSMWCNS